MFTPTTMRAILIGAALAAAPVAATLAADERQSLEELRNTVINLLQALVDQGVMTRDKATQLVKAAQEKASADRDAQAKADEGAVRVPYVPQIVKDEIARQVAEQVKPAVVADVVADAKAEQWGVPGALADWLKNTRLSGSVTLREEDVIFAKDNVPNYYLNYFAINSAGGITKAGINAYENVNVDRVRFRARARLAVDSDISDSISAGMRIVTGNTSDLVSETQTADGTAPYQIGLDELFLRFDERNAQRFPWLSVVGGRYLNPYGTPTDLIFHKDLTFTGLAVTGRIGFGDGGADQSHVFMTLGAHPLQEIALSGSDKWLVAGQIGVNFRDAEGQHLRVSGALFDYMNTTGIRNPLGTNNSGGVGPFNYTAPVYERQGNTYFDISNSTDTTVNLFALAARYRLVNLNVSYEMPVGRYAFGITGDFVHNIGYDTNQTSANFGSYVAARTRGYQGEASFGHPSVLTAGAWRAVVGYRHLQRDAVIDAYTDSDFHWGGTDAKGYYLVGDYGFANKVWMRVRYLSSNAIDGPTLGIDTLQIDLNTRF